ncbi:MAG: NYN domain-containing protein [bacterium]|nr:NYN domain-containing protein [bacterium]
MRKVIAYIDGFSLYHALHDLRKPYLKWLNLWDLMESLLHEDEELISVFYFSAFATWRKDSVKRHKVYVQALENTGTTPIMGHFKQKIRSCKKCRDQWIDHEEKETDVNIAISMLRDAYEERFDRAVIVTSDSDLVPVIKAINSRFPEKSILVATPPKRHELSRDLRVHAKSYSLTPGRIKNHLFSKLEKSDDGTLEITRPDEYRPPPIERKEERIH